MKIKSKLKQKSENLILTFNILILEFLQKFCQLISDFNFLMNEYHRWKKFQDFFIGFSNRLFLIYMGKLKKKITVVIFVKTKIKTLPVAFDYDGLEY